MKFLDIEKSPTLIFTHKKMDTVQEGGWTIPSKHKRWQARQAKKNQFTAADQKRELNHNTKNITAELLQSLRGYLVPLKTIRQEQERQQEHQEQREQQLQQQREQQLQQQRKQQLQQQLQQKREQQLQQQLQQKREQQLQQQRQCQGYQNTANASIMLDAADPQDQRQDLRQGYQNTANASIMLDAADPQRQLDAAESQRQLNAAKRQDQLNADVEKGKSQIRSIMLFHACWFRPPSAMTAEQAAEQAEIKAKLNAEIKKHMREMLKKYPACVRKILRDHFNDTYCKKPSA